MPGLCMLLQHNIASMQYQLRMSKYYSGTLKMKHVKFLEIITFEPLVILFLPAGNPGCHYFEISETSLFLSELLYPKALSGKPECNLDGRGTGVRWSSCCCSSVL